MTRQLVYTRPPQKVSAQELGQNGQVETLMNELKFGRLSLADVREAVASVARSDIVYAMNTVALAKAAVVVLDLTAGGDIDGFGVHRKQFPALFVEAGLQHIIRSPMTYKRAVREAAEAALRTLGGESISTTPVTEDIETT